MGREVLLAFLHDIPGLNDVSVRYQLANLKTSGDYARLLAEVAQDLRERSLARGDIDH
jgi:hypothetical protein